MNQKSAAHPKAYSSDDIQIWEKIIDVQMHFNEIKSKNQTLFVSIITTSLAGSGFLYKEVNTPLDIHLWQLHFPLYVYTLPILGATVFTLAFYILDFGIYHTLLKGAVTCGQEFEKTQLGQSLTSSAIADKSRFNHTLGFRGAGNKQKAFYGIIGFALLVLFIILNWWATPK